MEYPENLLYGEVLWIVFDVIPQYPVITRMITRVQNQQRVYLVFKVGEK